MSVWKRKLTDTQVEFMLLEHQKRLQMWKAGLTDLDMCDKCFCILAEIIKWRENHKLKANKEVIEMDVSRVKLEKLIAEALTLGKLKCPDTVICHLIMPTNEQCTKCHIDSVKEKIW